MANNQLANVENSVKGLLRSQWKNIQIMLPKHLTPERLCMVAVQTILQTPALAECSPESLCNAIVQASTMGLELDMRGHAYLVPFQNKKTGRKEVQLIIGYKGLMELGYRSGRVTSILSEIVYENDYFKITLGMSPNIEHEPTMGDRGEMIGVYAIARMREADPIFTFMTREDVEKVKKASKASFGPWVDWEEEMWRKTAVRRLAKMLPLTPELQKGAAVDENYDKAGEQGFVNYFENLANQQAAAPAANAAAALNSAVQGEAIDVPAREKPAPVTKGRTQGPSAPRQQAAPAPAPSNGGNMVDCPILGIDGAPRMVPETECQNCKELKNGCPSWSF